MSLPFLLEIGTEEIPDWMILSALEDLRAAFVKLGIAHEGLRTDATPRRLVLRAHGLPERQADSVERVQGPGKSAPAQAVEGFARKQGVPPSDLTLETTPKGEYYVFHKKVEGRATKDILAAALAGIVLGINFPKTMYWTGKGGPRFIRPIRWLVALLGDETVPFEIGGVHSGNLTSGHRRLGAHEVVVTCGDYERRLRDHGVILSAEERRERILSGLGRSLTVAVPKAGQADATGATDADPAPQMGAANEGATPQVGAAAAGPGAGATPQAPAAGAIPSHLQNRDREGAAGGAKVDAALLETLVYLTEFPTAIEGSFDAAFLVLPSEVLVTVMRHHQRYFSVEDAEGKLLPKFVAVMNIGSDPEGFVRRGNERVLRARFSDARFFWDSDQKKKLADRRADLASVTFQAKLGSYRDKAKRMKLLVKELGGKASAARAADLCKCDLTTELVKEFTELQGVVGGLYARAQGEREEVWQAIYDHYKPVSMEDSIPRHKTGRLVALADKLDTLRGCFRVGLIPTGSKDPFALRRAAQGVVKILVEGRMELPLLNLLEGNAELIAFFQERVKFYFKDVRGFQYDEVNAAMAAGWSNLVDLEARLERLRGLRGSPDFEPLAASFKRIRNILEQAKFDGGVGVRQELLEEEPEKELFREYQNIAGQPIETVIAALRPKVDLFFDKVLVNSPNEEVRRNRLQLLFELRREFSKVADFSEIVTTS
jgi:glycyl-tRNA synthetase beta chain